MKKSGIISLLSLTLLSIPSFGQLDSLLNQNFSLADLMNIEVVSATRSKVKLQKAPANIMVITAQQIKSRGYRTLEEVFKDLPGFDFSGGQPAGEYPTHFLFRGIGDLGQAKVVLLVDGVAQNDISNGWVQNIGYNFVMSDIERIEFISGPGSSLFGANAYAAMINVITKDGRTSGEDVLSVEVQNSVGNHGTYYPEVALNYTPNEQTSLNISGRYYSSVGDKGLNRYDPGNYFHNNFEPDSVKTTEHGIIANDRNPDGSRKAVPDGFDNFVEDWYLRGKFQNRSFTAGFNFWDRMEGLGSEVIGYEYFANTPGIQYRAHHQGYHFYGQFEYDISESISGMSRVYFRNTSILPKTGFVYTFQYQSVDNGIDSAVVDKVKGYHGEGFLMGTEHKYNYYISDKNHVIVGVQAEQQIRQYFGISLGHLQDRTSTYVGVPFSSQNLPVQPVYFSKNVAAYLHDQHQFSDNLSLTLGVRYDYDQFYGAKINPRASLVYSKPKGLNAKFLFGSAYRPPSIFQRFDEWRGNNNLIAETINSTELELGYLIPKKGSIKFNAFHNSLNNLVKEAPNPDTTLVPIGSAGQFTNYYQNIGRQGIIGASLRGNFELAKNLEFSGNYQWLRDDNFELLNNVSEHKLNLGFTYYWKNKLSVNLRANSISKIKAPETNWYFYEKTSEKINQIGYDYVTEDNPDGFHKGSTILNATITGYNFKLGKKVTLEPQLIVRNLLGTKYAYIGRQSGNGIRPVDSLQPTVMNPVGFIPAYHPQALREVFVGLNLIF